MHAQTDNRKKKKTATEKIHKEFYVDFITITHHVTTFLVYALHIFSHTTPSDRPTDTD